MRSCTSPPLEQTAEWVATLTAPMPDLSALVTEDDTPVDNLFSAKQQRLLVEPLYTSWSGPGEGRSFLADANVGLFHAVSQPPLVPDAFLSLDVQVPADVWAKAGRSYLLWEYGKPPDVVIEIVANQKGEEAERKLRLYEQIGISYYVIFDPTGQLRAGPLRISHYLNNAYRQLDQGWLPRVGLGVSLWQGVYEGLATTWLRWCDQDGNVIPTGAERVAQERQRAERLAAQLRALGVEPQEA